MRKLAFGALMIGLLTPPVGTVLYVLSSVAEVRVGPGSPLAGQTLVIDGGSTIYGGEV